MDVQSPEEVKQDIQNIDNFERKVSLSGYPKLSTWKEYRKRSLYLMKVLKQLC